MKTLKLNSIGALLLLAFGLIAYGHVAIMSSSELFDKVNHAPYDLHRRWVSDFAAKWPEGMWVKAGILLTCVAAGLLYREKYKALPERPTHSLRKWLYIIIPVLIIGGLVMVMAYDVSRPRSQWETSGIWPFKFRELAHVPKTKTEWTIEWYHNLGFRIFVVGFFLAMIAEFVIRMIHDKEVPPPVDCILFALTLICAGWLFISFESLPGIPQRFLLAFAFLWFWRDAGVHRLRVRRQTGD